MLPRTAETYSDSYLEIDRPRPLIDKKIESLITQGIDESINIYSKDYSIVEFKDLFKEWISKSTENNFSGLENFFRSDICSGCTQFIDNIYMQNSVQVIRGDYRYHERLNPDIIYRVPGNLKKNIPLIIALPFPSLGFEHPQMTNILEECLHKNIPVHIDGAWLTCSRSINFDFSHPSIESVAISLSKGLGLGWNRVALRWIKSGKPDAITIMNDYHMNLLSPIVIAEYFLKNIEPDHLWKTHRDRYHKVCEDFDLTPTKSIHIALKNDQPVGISSLIRYLENESL